MTALTWVALVLMAAGTLAWVLAPLFDGRGRDEKFVSGTSGAFRSADEEIELAVARLRRVQGGEGDEP